MHRQLFSLAAPGAAAMTAFTNPFLLTVQTPAGQDLTPSINNTQLKWPQDQGCFTDIVLVGPPANAAVPFEPTQWIYNSTTRTLQGSTCKSGFLIVSGGTPTVPSGRPAQVIALITATTSIDVQQNANNQSVLAYENGHWMVCPSTSCEGTRATAFLSFRVDGQRRIAGCVDADLVLTPTK